MFRDAKLFNSDLSKWDVSSVEDMSSMFSCAALFNGDLSKWDVSSVTNMAFMFKDAGSFKRELCGSAWVHSKARKPKMFEGSPGSISKAVCTSAPTHASTRMITRQPLTERELVVHTPITTSVSAPTVTSTIGKDKLACPKCARFKHTGQVSCCALGGAWYRQCGGPETKHAKHSWIEGVKACACRFTRLRACTCQPPEDSIHCCCWDISDLYHGLAGKNACTYST